MVREGDAREDGEPEGGIRVIVTASGFDDGPDDFFDETLDAPPTGPADDASVDRGDASPSRLLEEGVRAALDREAVSRGEISLTLLDDAGIRDLNRRYLDRDRPTDVIAFPLYEANEPVVGDVYVGVDQARRQAAELEIPLREELLRLAVHGTLHVLGHDHPEDSGREDSEMFRIQEELVKRVLGVTS